MASLNANNFESHLVTFQLPPRPSHTPPPFSSNDTKSDNATLSGLDTSDWLDINPSRRAWVQDLEKFIDIHYPGTGDFEQGMNSLILDYQTLKSQKQSATTEHKMGLEPVPAVSGASLEAKPARTRRRRCYTEEEKAEIKETRKRRACKACSARHKKVCFLLSSKLRLNG
jgi:hypothetical protein